MGFIGGSVSVLGHRDRTVTFLLKKKTRFPRPPPLSENQLSSLKGVFQKCIINLPSGLHILYFNKMTGTVSIYCGFFWFSASDQMNSACLCTTRPAGVRLCVLKKPSVYRGLQPEAPEHVWLFYPTKVALWLKKTE